ncbi:hypothetical protein ATANTOWER_014156, partial [Ataeniobius toweri]|nr:hypothetical protein [Ataeniobius toweri]
FPVNLALEKEDYRSSCCSGSFTNQGTFVIHHSDLCSLRPHQWLNGEVIESFSCGCPCIRSGGHHLHPQSLHSWCDFVWGQNRASSLKFTEGEL